MLDRRNFLKAVGVGVVAPLGLVGKAKPAVVPPAESSETLQEMIERRRLEMYERMQGDMDVAFFDSTDPFASNFIVAHRIRWVDGKMETEHLTADQFYKSDRGFHA
jgi:hypothetical protein